ncbi:hypothetical protein BC826DRAFT_1114212 [Russula brevipes]|nr:hypothetical protein BC826DRAFT_1114212 [Russula brevipes]
MYFGLTNAPPFFQRMMHRDFADLLQRYPENLDNYMDDWWIATGSDDKGRKLHEEITHAFLDRMEECSYFLKPSNVGELHSRELPRAVHSREHFTLGSNSIPGSNSLPGAIRTPGSKSLLDRFTPGTLLGVIDSRE